MSSSAAGACGNAARTSTPEAPELQGYLAAMLPAGRAGPSSSRRRTASHSSASAASPTTSRCSPISPRSTSSSTARWRPIARPSDSLFARLDGATRTPRKAGASTRWSTPTIPRPWPRRPRHARRVPRSWAMGSAGRARPWTRPGARPGCDRARRDVRPMQVPMRTSTGRARCDLRLAGRFNVYNALAAMGVAMALGLDPDAAAEPSASWRRYRVACSGSMPARNSASSSTTRTPQSRSERSSTSWHRATPTPGSSWCSGRPATETPRSGTPWAESRAALSAGRPHRRGST